jgi:GMP synthase-like glutamine amidotransferase
MTSASTIKVGILETGEPPAHLEGRFGRYKDMFEDLLGPGYRMTNHNVVGGSFPADPAEEEAYIVTGSPAGVYDAFEWIPRLIAFLRETKGKAKLVGICFGHQVMAEAFGGRVEKSDRGWGIGLHRYEVRDPAHWMDAVHSFAIPVSHQDQIVAQPPASRIVAASPFTRFGVLEYQDQPAISFQCHPEFDPAYVEALIEHRRARLADADAAIASLKAPNDRALVAGWIRRFLDGSAAADV